ncbi:MAG: hypothetical protein AABX34_04175 [Nanoarchaeota archaeon]
MVFFVFTAKINSVLVTTEQLFNIIKRVLDEEAKLDDTQADFFKIK